MLPTAMLIADTPKPMSGMPGDVPSKNADSSVSVSFKDHLHFHEVSGVDQTTSGVAVPTRALEVADSSSELSSLFMNGDCAPSPAPEDGATSTKSVIAPQEDASKEDRSPEDTLQADPQGEPQGLTKELLESAVTPTAKEPERGESGHIARAFVTKEDKTSSKRNGIPSMTSGALATGQADLVPTSVNIVAVDPGKPMVDGKIALLIKTSEDAAGSAKLHSGIASVKTLNVNLATSVEQPAPQESEFTELANRVVGSSAPAADDQLTSPDGVKVEAGEKVAHAAGVSEPSFAVPVPPTSVVFHLSLLREEGSNVQLAIPDDESMLPTSETTAVSDLRSPVNHLDLQWKDGALGSISVRAEMREGSLHATVNGSHVSSTVSVTDLHQFLEDNRIAVHSLQVNGVAETKLVSERHGLAVDAPVANGGQAPSLSHRDDNSGSGARERTTPGRSRKEVQEIPVAISSAAISFVGQASNGRLSIHI
ncbi:hypothetical protein [Terriglobus sp. TAA 43]|uniref:hypothetical protein n=1 Tax=Terriglobus sp. TAA 43 TaxID=278961 RepID=UPI000648C8B9|nr:hypothetical protein [Terriglobus sp. TAA 43]